MRIKQIIFAIATVGAILGIGATAFASGPGKGPHNGDRFDVEKKVEKMTERLELDEQQAAKIRTIMKRSKADIDAVRASDEERSEKRKEMRAIRESTRAEVEAVLTPAQLDKAREHRATMKKRHQKMRKRHGARGMRGLKKKLDLSDDQVAQIREVRKEAKSDMRAIVKDDFDGDRAAAADKLRERREQMVSDIEGLLTPDQVTRFAELRQKMIERRGKGHHRKNRSK